MFLCIWWDGKWGKQELWDGRGYGWSVWMLLKAGGAVRLQRCAVILQPHRAPGMVMAVDVVMVYWSLEMENRLAHSTATCWELLFRPSISHCLSCSSANAPGELGPIGISHLRMYNWSCLPENYLRQQWGVTESPSWESCFGTFCLCPSAFSAPVSCFVISVFGRPSSAG